MQVIKSSLSAARRALGSRRGQVIIAVTAALALFATRARDVVSTVPDKARSVAEGASAQVRGRIGQGQLDSEAVAAQSIAVTTNAPIVTGSDHANGTEPAVQSKETPDTSPAGENGAGNWVEGDGSYNCPEGYPIKGNATSHIYHLPGGANYDRTIPNFCFATEEDAVAAGYRPRSK